MTETRTFDALVDLARSIRPSWDTPGIRAAVRQSLARDPQPTLAELAYALIRCAENPTVNTPGLVALDGPHWAKATPETSEPARTRYCRSCSQFHFPSKPCLPPLSSGKAPADLVAAAKARLGTTPRPAVRCTCDPGPDGWPHREWCGTNINPNPDQAREASRQRARAHIDRTEEA